jgi:hypothetical protein
MSNENQTMSIEEQLAALQAENAKLKAAQAKRTTITLKVSEKGGISAYGLGRFPCTLYAQQWLKLLDQADNIRVFIETNKSKLTFKDQ